MQYEATLDSLRTHPVPSWFHDAKLGIFVHWGLYSVPAWVDTSIGSVGDVMDHVGPRGFFVHSPYAEWYGNTMKLPDSPTHRFHAQTYGADFEYADFAPRFNEDSAGWDPDRWARLFRMVGARYVVLTTKHHDGFLLWPSATENPCRSGFGARRDIVAELAEAVRKYDMRMGLYYSSGLDWTFNPKPLRDIIDLISSMPQSARYCRYVEAHWKELIVRYHPDVLWNDIGYPYRLDLPTLFARYYNHVNDGVINDRVMQIPLAVARLAQLPGLHRLMNHFAGLLYRRHAEVPARAHFDFATPEYASFSATQKRKWEATRGIGHSFGYNRNEGEQEHLSTQALIHSFVDIVSKNGNLLLNVGPRSDGSIPDLQMDRLIGLGQWLKFNGEAIFGTRPWVRSEGWCQTASGSIPVRFTKKQDTLYAIVLGEPEPGELKLRRIHASDGATVRLLGHRQTVQSQRDCDGIAVTWPERENRSHARSLAVTPVPTWAEESAPP